MSDNNLPSYHCTCIKINNIGLMIEGPSGSGKSSLALALTENAALSGYSALLISDDQALMEAEGDQLFATAPETLAGKIEVRGYGIIEVPHEKRAQISRVFKLVNSDDVPRLGEMEMVDRFGVQLEAHKLPIGEEARQVRLILLHLEISPLGQSLL